ncbi:MAG: hypothetical protein A3G73_07965 [Rhodospirillales bacterium RIFCSPLOWO2_12_FULL_67_15]|nr:MAG: hypothetical protein A3G73_07965 [Rhodospirillales bacterium RIFCSPLOWO2_12_FULL_67_15]
MSDLVAALGLAMAIEGILYALFPDGMRRMMERALALPPRVIRATGLVAALAGVGLVWLARG